MGCGGAGIPKCRSPPRPCRLPGPPRRRAWHQAPWELGELLLDDSGRTIRFDRIPLFAEHICVPPHTAVATARHSYSFTENGTQLCFHSPESLGEGCVPFCNWLSRLSSANGAEETYITAETAQKALHDLVTAESDNSGLPFPADMFENGDGIRAWLYWGQFLQENYGIEQYALTRWS